MSRKRKNKQRVSCLSLIIVAGLCIAALCCCIMYYALQFEPHWIEVTKHDVKFENFSENLPQLTIVQMSDFHAGNKMSESQIRQAAAIANSLSPDVIVLTGDFVHNKPEAAEPCARALSGLKAKYGIFAVLGNHDYSVGSAPPTVALKNQGFKILKNNNIKIAGNVWLIGIDDFSSGWPDPAAAFSGVPSGAVRVVISHNPKIFPKIKDNNCFLIAAHTHGGQVDVPFIPRNYLPGLLSYDYVRGWYYEGNSRMYVNRGIGMVMPPMRFRCRPEIALFTLSRGTPEKYANPYAHKRPGPEARRHFAIIYMAMRAWFKDKW